MYYGNTLWCMDTIYIILKLLKGGRRPSSVGDYSLGETAAGNNIPPHTALYRRIPPLSVVIGSEPDSNRDRRTRTPQRGV